VVVTTTTGVELSLAAGRLFKVLADPTRVALLRRLADGRRR
jgi:DNA-binding transcriptional ArsR family regulator